MRAFSIIFSLLISTTALSASRFMLPQPKAASGPWFEGWYVRVTDIEHQRSFATITTSSTSAKIPLNAASILPGYIAFIYNKGPQAGTHSEEYYPTATQAVTQGEHFQWQADPFGTISDQALELKLPSGAEISITFGQRLPWSTKSPTWGPEGLPGYLPHLPLYWYVDSLGTPVSYRIKLPGSGEIQEGQGYAHIEKNWGRVFPSAWMWLQGTSPDNSTHIALAGGPLNFGPLSLTSYLVGYKSKTLNVEIHPDQLPLPHYKTMIDPCTGSFTLEASNAHYRIQVVAKSPVESFAPVSIPTREGFLPNHGMESFVTSIHVSIYEDGVFRESQNFQQAALEFGADYKICRPFTAPE